MDTENLYDLAIVGGGPAGLTAAIYMGRARYKTLVIEKEDKGGQIAITSEVVNYPGIRFTSGEKLMHTMQEQAKAFGATFVSGEVTDFELDDDIKTLHTKDGEEFKALTVLIATGANPRRLGFKGEDEFRGRGVAYCATCDGEFFTDMDIFVIGGGFAAAEEGIFLTRYGRKVTYILQTEDFTCAKTISDEVKANPKIDVHYRTEVVEVGGDKFMNYAVFKDLESGETWRYDAPEGQTFGLFVFAGYVPNSGPFQKAVSLDDRGYVITTSEQATNRSGIFAAGDVCIKTLRQLVTATSDGAIAAASAEKEAARLHGKLDLPPFALPATRINHGEAAEADTPEKADLGDDSGFLTAAVKEQVVGVMAKFDSPVTVRIFADDSDLGVALRGFGKEFDGISDKVKVEVLDKPEDLALSQIRLFDADGNDSGISYVGVPGGHEFNSFILAMYNLAGPGQAWSEAEKALADKLSGTRELKIVVSLACTMCPDVVQASQRLAAKYPDVSAQMIDMQYAPDLRKEHNIMSVPCLIIDDEQVSFGKKDLQGVLDLMVS